MVHPQLVLLEPDLTKGLDGHRVEYLVNIAEEARQRGIRTEVWVSRGIQPQVARALEDAQLELVHAFAPLAQPPVEMRLFRWLTNSWRFYQVLANRTTLQASGTRRIFCMIGAGLKHLLAAVLAQLVAPNDEPLILEFFEWSDTPQYADKFLMRPVSQLTTVLARYLLSDETAVAVAGQTEPISEQLQQALGFAITSLPMIVDWESYPLPACHRERPVVGYIGALEKRRGVDQLLKAFHRVQTSASWVFNIYERSDQPLFSIDDFTDQLGENADYNINIGPFVRTEFKQLFTDIDILLLPYNPQVYAHKTSGMFAEAVGLGKIVVVPKGTWMAKVVDQHGIGVTYSPHNAPALAAGIERAIAKRERYEQRLQKFAPAWRQRHSATCFLTELLNLAESRRAKHYR